MFLRHRDLGINNTKTFQTPETFESVLFEIVTLIHCENSNLHVVLLTLVKFDEHAMNLGKMMQTFYEKTHSWSDTRKIMNNSKNTG